VVSPSGITIGRSAPADIIVTGSAVSRSHCKVELAGDKLRVTDLNSTNGTFVDNKRIDRTAMLPAGSTLRVGNVTFEHEVVPRAEAAGLAEPMRFANVLPQGAARVAKS
jgi:pSer/pThr/pTyr-binding forkhead associated (FHA) protein